MTTKGSNDFGKEQKLKSRKRIAEIFELKKSTFAHPIKCFYLFDRSNIIEGPPRVAVVVPKRSFKKAVDRNRIKRLMREVYRLNSSNLKKYNIDLLMIFIGKGMPQYAEIEKGVKRIIHNLTKEVES